MTLTPERLAAIRALWEAAVEQPAAARAAFLLRSAPDDPDLRDAVAELLEAHDDTSGLFGHSLAPKATIGDVAPAASLAGRVLGAYRVTREIGQGGMGTVYEAERADDQFTKRVAIKTLRYAGDGALQRFARERRIQAALAHPNIATLLDAGVTEDLVPFIVLEFVDGLQIDEYCRTHRLGLKARIDLFQQVVRAVQHAHRQLVVHRDLKPSNILVTGGGVVKLLDFGISKLLDDSADHTATAGQRAFTTAYASPEQIRGETISTASDVYSLGVVLYRLLAGTNPFDLDNTSSSAAWTRILESEPTAPSNAATDDAATAMGFAGAARLRRELEGELDAIVLKALRKEPDRRYPTADALGEDLQRYLRGLPVGARPDSAGYRLGKFASRNRLATAAVVVAILAMGVGTTVAVRQANAARRATAVAEAERQTATKVSAFLQQMFSAADRSWAGAGRGPNTTIGEVIDSAAGLVDRELADEPGVAEALHRILESTYTALQRTDRGIHHSRRVMGLMRARHASGPEIARGLHDLGSLYWLSGKRDSALVLLRESYALFEAAGFPESEDLALTLNQLGLTLWDMGNPEEAEPHLRQSLAVRRKAVGEDAAAAIITSNLGLVRQQQGDLDGAEDLFRQAEGIYAALSEREYFEHGYNLNNLGYLLLLKGNVAEADQVSRQSVAVLRQFLGPDHRMVGLGMMNVARVELAGGRATDALATLREGRERLSQLPPGHPDLAKADTYEASILLALGRAADAEALARRALLVRREAYPDGDWRIAETEGVLGHIKVARGAVAEGRTLLGRSLDGMRRALGPDHPHTRSAAVALEAVQPD